MADKKYARYRKVSAEDLRKLKEEFNGYAGEMFEMASTMDNESIPAVDVDGGGQAQRAADLMFNFVHATDKAVKKAQRDLRK
ncbi:MAG TPA: hypothetical protein VGH74_01245 [Planctomycetaceae bacterium]|jgi:hypothetical protein